MIEEDNPIERDERKLDHSLYTSSHLSQNG
jgi:hypothetical protein